MAPPSPNDEQRVGESVRGLNTLVGDVASVTGARIAGLALAIVALVLTTRLLGPAEYAVIAYVAVGATLVLYASAGWSATAVTRYGREELERTGGLHRTSWARTALTAPLVAASSALLVALKAGDVLPLEFTWTFVWLTIVLGSFIVIADHLAVLLETAGRMRVSAVALAGRQALLAIGLLVIAISGAGRSPLGVVSLSIGVAILLAIALALPLRHLALWPPRLDRAQLRRVLLFSLPLVAFTASQYGMRSVDIVVLRAYRPPADVGVYALAYQGYTMLQQVATTVTIVLVPLFVSLREAGRSELVARYFRRLVPQATLLAAMAGGALAPLIVLALPLVLGDAYSDAARPLAVLTAALVLFAVASLLAPVLVLHERSGATAAVNMVALGVNAVGDIVLVGPLNAGVMGPAIATVAALAVIVGGYLMVARRDLGVGPVAHPALLAPVVAGVLPAVLLPAAVGVPLGAAAAVLTSALVLWRVPLFLPEDLDLIGRLDIPEPIRARLLPAIERLVR